MLCHKQCRNCCKQDKPRKRKMAHQGGHQRNGAEHLHHYGHPAPLLRQPSGPQQSLYARQLVQHPPQISQCSSSQVSVRAWRACSCQSASLQAGGSSTPIWTLASVSPVRRRQKALLLVFRRAEATHAGAQGRAQLAGCSGLWL